MVAAMLHRGAVLQPVATNSEEQCWADGKVQRQAKPLASPFHSPAAPKN